VATSAKGTGPVGPAPSSSETVRVDGFTVAELEKLAITQTLRRCAGNRTKAAKMLGISVRTLQRKLRAWNGKSHNI
jgi:DNA-binding NtrC family response regulator